MAAMTFQCYADKIRLKHGPPKASELQEEAITDEGDQIRSATDQERYDRVKSSTPCGFHELLQKVTLNVVIPVVIGAPATSSNLFTNILKFAA